MYRQGLRRCANPASTLRSAATIARPRLSFGITHHKLITPRSAPAWRSIGSIGRTYSTEAAAPVQDAEDVNTSATSGPVENFADLQKLGVHNSLLKSITQGMGYERMTPVQAKTINPALKGTDIVAQAKTGTGKTIAFLLPLLQRMINEDPSLASRGASRRAACDDIRGIVLSPTRELAEQIAAEARQLTKHTGLVVQTAVGGTNKTAMLKKTQREGCHLLVGTPGRLHDLLSDERSGIEAPNLAAMVLDEADRMLDVGFEKELNDIIDMLPNVNDKVRQTMLVSATIPDDVIRLARSMVRPQDFEFVQTIPENESLTHDKVPQKVVPVASWANVFPTMYELIEREKLKAEENPDSPPFKAIIYFNTTAMVQLAGELDFMRRKEGITRLPSFSIHSKLSQDRRTRAAENFRRARSAILISSDVTARGMDFPNVTHVIQVDQPRDRESYIHRLGRTGRQDKYGEGFLILPPISVSVARSQLRGMPLSQETSLECAQADLTVEGTEQSLFFQQFQDLVRLIDRSMMTNAYTSLFGNTPSKPDLAEDLHHWVTRGWGWKDPPSLSPDFVRKLGMDTRSQFLNVSEGYSRQGGSGGRFRGGEFGDRDGGRRDRDGGNRDPFNAMRRDVRSDSPFRGGGGGGFGGDRGRGRGRNDSRGDAW